MEVESLPFESSEMLASFLASTPFLKESWRLCSLANSAGPRSFLVEQRGEIGYVAFSGIPVIDESDWSYGTLVALGDCGCEHLFSPLKCDTGYEDEETVKVDAGFVRLFLELNRRPDFQNPFWELQENVRTIIFTGHSFGATTASLTALWLLSYLQSIVFPISVLCITFGAPLLGNESLSQAVLLQRWDGSFCNIISKLDIVPRLFFAPLVHLTPQLHWLLQFWQADTASPGLEHLIGQLHKQNFSEFFNNVLDCVEVATQSERKAKNESFWPLGSYLFCSEEGAICVDNAMSVIRMMHLMLKTGSPASSIEDHLKYGYYIGLLSSQFLKKPDVSGLSASSYEAGVFLALQSLGLDPQDDNISKQAKDSLAMTRHMGRAPNLNNAHLAIQLSKITPLRAQIEWYKTRCDESCDQIGYYDTFKKFGESRMDSKIDMNLFMLASFWDGVIGMVERNELSHDFHHLPKWVNASHFYQLLAEPLEIARYYRHGMHLEKGHYVEHGRHRRHQIFDRWWSRKIGVETQQQEQQIKNNSGRSRFASLTQDSCFWAKVEEAKDWLMNAETERDSNKLALLLANINGFEKYANELIEMKEVSIDVLAKNSSYTLWSKEWEALKFKFQRPPSDPALSGMDCDKK